MGALCYILVFVLLAVPPAAAASPRSIKKKTTKSKWLPTSATFYGTSDGDGTSGGACGYTTLAEKRPYKGHTTAVSEVLFNNGKGCGACYKIRCLDINVCSRKPASVVVIDRSPGEDKTHFDLSGAAMNRMSKDTVGTQLRNHGFFSNDTVVYIRASCRYTNRGISLRVNEGSTEFWLSLLVMYQNGDGTVKSMEIRNKNSNWQKMEHVWGATYSANGFGQGPFSIRINASTKSRTLTNVIPEKWEISKSYSSDRNF